MRSQSCRLKREREPIMNVTVYSRPGCHLCEDAVAMLAGYGLRASEVNIDEDPRLLAEYHTCVPVVEIDGKVRFRGRVDRVLLDRLLTQLPGNRHESGDFELG